jgi:hypothetical protein
MTLADLIPQLIAIYEKHGDLPLATGFDDHKPIVGALVSEFEKTSELGKKGERFVDFY